MRIFRLVLVYRWPSCHPEFEDRYPGKFVYKQ